MDGLWVVAAAVFLAAANGANDAFKGVATLRGSGLFGYRAALALATLSTAAGSIAAARLGGGLAALFVRPPMPWPERPSVPVW